MNVRSWLLQIAIMAAALAYAEPASALRQVTVPAEHVSFVGMIFGDAFVASLPVSPAQPATCTFIILGLGGLTDATQVSGSGLHDQIIVTNTSTSFCGFPMTPIVRNGHSLLLNGGSGNDLLMGGNHASVRGDNNDDIITSNLTNSILLGGGGNDTLISSNSTTRLRGEASNDALCVDAPAVHVQELNGGDHIDTRCGAAHQIISVESTSCALCDVF